MTKNKTFLIAFIGFILLTAHAKAQPLSSEGYTIAPNLVSFELENGLQVAVIPDHRAPVVTHMLWYKVGSADEPAGQSGVAHFLEHLMFKGTSNYPDGAFSKMIAELGGQENAFTSLDYTAYYQRIAKEHLPLMMTLEADRMQNLVLSDTVVDPERLVVLEERRSRVDRNPGSRLGEALNAITFVNHPYGSPVIGWESEIEALNKESALAFYDRFYTPNNAILIIAGDVEPNEIQKLAAETYGKVPRRAEPGKRIRPKEPPLAGERRISLADPRVRQDSHSQIRIVPSQITGEGKTPLALDILAYILGDGPSSRLHKSMVIDRQAALSAGAYYQSGSLDEARFGIYASPRPGFSIEDMERLIADEVELLLEKGVSEKEVKRAQNSMIASAIYAQDNQFQMARIFGSSLSIGLTVEDVQTWPTRIQTVTADDVLEAAREYLSKPAVIGNLLQETPAKQVTGETGDKS